MMLRRFLGACGLDALILVSWLAAVGWVVSYEYGLPGAMLRLSRQLISSRDANEQWFGVYYHGHKMGFTHTTLLPDERNGMPGFELVDAGHLRLNLMGTLQRLDLQARAFIDADHRLQTFSATARSEGFDLTMTGTRQGDELLLTLASPTGSMTQRLRDPSGELWLSGLSSWAAFHRLAPGQQGRIHVLNLLTLTPESATFQVIGRESVQGREVLVVQTDFQGLTSQTWLTPDGVVMKETSPLGWELVQEPVERAIAHVEDTPGIDLLSTVAVPIDRPLEDVASRTTLTLLVEGVDGRAFQVDRRPWQELLSPERLAAYRVQAPHGAWCVIRLHRAPTQDSEAERVPPERRYTQPSLFIQSDNPWIRQQAKDIVGGLSEPSQQAQAINRWIFETLTKRLTVGIPSATDVLATKAGDCHEHTVLFTALARSLGIPTRMIAGLVYYGDRFYYHAWPEVWLVTSGLPRSADAPSGAWVPLDPTLGQPVADLTHIGLAEAEADRLVALGRFVGRLRLRVLE